MGASLVRLQGRLIYIVLLSCLVLAGCTGFDQTADTQEVIKSPNDSLAYRHITLDNGLKVLLVSDPAADKAAAALDVYVGSAQDPRDRQGLAHFLEHMLFLGTDKYPDSGEYQTFINQHGGQHNAYTSFQHTNYFFDIDPEYFAEGLDRFARFFVAPLFNTEYVDREKNAVHSEYQARIKNDSRRQMDVLQQVFSAQHPASTFSVGSLQTLAERPGETVRDALLDFYQDYYSADRMALVILAPEPLDELEQSARVLFADVPRNQAKPITIDVPFFDAETLPALVSMEPVSEMRQLSLMFPVADDRLRYREKPLSYVANLLGHEGQGSLLALLKDLGYAEALWAGPSLGDGEKSLFQLTISLTPRGLASWFDVVDLVFEQVALIREQGVERWRHEEQGNLAEMQFRFVEKTEGVSYVSRLASQMQDYPVVDILRGPYMMDRYNQKLIDRVLEQLTTDNVLIALTAPGLETDSQSPFYRTPYRLSDIDSQHLAKWQAIETQAGLQLPEKNPYVPEDFALAEVETAKKPESLDATNYHAWYVPDTSFGVPKIELKAAFESAVVETVEDSAKTALLLSVIEDNLSSQTYPSALAGLGYGFGMSANGFGFSVSGYSDKLDVLLNKVLGQLQSPKLDPVVIERVKTELARRWGNATKRDPYIQVWSRVPETLELTNHSPLEMAQVLESVSHEDLDAFSKRLFKDTRLTLLVGGSLSEQQAQELIRPVVSLLPANGQGQPSAARGVIKIDQSYHEDVEIDHTDTALVRYFQGRTDSIDEQARFLLLRQLLKAPFFNELRTEQQLGYIVAAVNLKIDRVPGVGLIVQSPVADRQAIEKAMDDFLQDFAKQLSEFSEADIAVHREAVITGLKEKPKNLRERVARDWRAINLRYYDFAIDQQLIDAIGNYSLEQIRADFSAIFLENKKWLQVVSTQDSVEGDSDLPMQTFPKGA